MGFITAKYNKRVEFTIQGVRHIIAKHPEISGMLAEIGETLKGPTIILRSKNDKAVWIFYRFYERHKGYLCVVVKILDGEGLLLTSYITDRIKIGGFI